MQQSAVTTEVQHFLLIASGLGAALLLTSLTAAWKGSFSQVFWRSIKFVSSIFAVISVVLFLANFEKAVKSAELYALAEQSRSAAAQANSFSSAGKILCGGIIFKSVKSDVCENLNAIVILTKRIIDQPTEIIDLKPDEKSKLSAAVASLYSEIIEQHNARLRDLKSEFSAVKPGWYKAALYSAVFFLIISVSGSAGEALFQLKTSIADSRRKSADVAAKNMAALLQPQAAEETPPDRTIKNC